MTYKKKLIEVAIPLAKINEESARDKGIRNHPQALHRWWARRPLAAARAVVFAQLVDDPSAHPDHFPTEEAQHAERKRLFDIIERMVTWEAAHDEGVLREAREEIRKSCAGALPKVLDPFAGGGAIPLETLRLGLPTYSGDLNPVAVLIQRAMLEIPQRFTNCPPVHFDARANDNRRFWTGVEGLAADVEAFGRWMRQEAVRRIGSYYPDVTLEDGSRATPIAWIWARTVKSPDPAWSEHVPLVRSWELSKKPGKPSVWIEPVVDRGAKTISYHVRTGGKVPDGSIGRQGAVCIATGSPITFNYIRAEAQASRMGTTLIAVVAEGIGGRTYAAGDGADMKDVPPANGPVAGSIFDWPGRMNVVRYGLDEWAKLFTPRQLLALTTFSDLLEDVRTAVLADAVNLPDDGVHLRDGGVGRIAYAEAVVTYLALRLVRQLTSTALLRAGTPPTSRSAIRSHGKRFQ